MKQAVSSHPSSPIHELVNPQELRQVEDLQLLVWGESEREVFPRDALRAIQHAGGLVAGTFCEGQLVGVVVGFPSAQADLQHSHMLAVHPDWRGGGLARALKEYQRDWCLARGVQRIEWTYDPLRAVNAHFNIHRLGATAHEYLNNFYGEMGGINAGIPSDRLVAYWTLRQPARRHPQPARLPAANSASDGSPVHNAAAEGVRIHIPADLPRLLAYDPAHALAWRLGTRECFHTWLGQGFQVTDFLRGDHPAYVLTPQE